MRRWLHLLWAQDGEKDNDVLYIWRHRLTAMPPLFRIFSVTKWLTIVFSRLICERHKYSSLDPTVSGTDYVRRDHTRTSLYFQINKFWLNHHLEAWNRDCSGCPDTRFDAIYKLFIYHPLEWLGVCCWKVYICSSKAFQVHSFTFIYSARRSIWR